jgi:hypothetical protein
VKETSESKVLPFLKFISFTFGLCNFLLNKNTFFFVNCSITLSQYRDYVASDGRMIHKWRMGRYLEGSSRGPIGTASWHLPHGTEEN